MASQEPGTCKDARPIEFDASGSHLGRRAPAWTQSVACASRGVTWLGGGGWV